MQIPLMVDGKRVGKIDIGRTRTHDDGVHTYMWTIWTSGDPNGFRASSIVSHRESDGPFVLLHKVLEAFHTSSFAMMADITAAAVEEMNNVRRNR